MADALVKLEKHDSYLEIGVLSLSAIDQIAMTVFGTSYENIGYLERVTIQESGYLQFW